jgi:hypothetical protein
MASRQSSLRDVAAAVLVTGALALPFLPFPGDGAARMKVHFRTADAEHARAFTTETSRSLCLVMAAALTYENRDSGTFTRVACDEQPDAP